jgi:hypothetical protein
MASTASFTRATSAWAMGYGPNPRAIAFIAMENGLFASVICMCIWNWRSGDDRRVRMANQVSVKWLPC